MPKEDVIAHISGCPFTDFGPCTTIKCTFFIAIDGNLSERECMFKENYFQTLRTYVTQQIATIGEQTAPSLLQADHVEQRLVEGLIAALHRLDGLATHPHTGRNTKATILSLKQNLKNALDDFAKP